MEPVFLELIFNASDCAKVGLNSRDEIEDDFQEKFEKSQLGLISGGGGGMGKYNIDVDVYDEQKLEQAVSLIREYLIALDVPRSSKIVRHKPQREELSVYI